MPRCTSNNHVGALLGVGNEKDEEGCRAQLDLILIGDLIDLDPRVNSGSIHGLIIT